MKISDIPIFLYDLGNNRLLDATPAYKRLREAVSVDGSLNIEDCVKIHPLTHPTSSLVVGLILEISNKEAAKAYLSSLNEDEIRALIQELPPSQDHEAPQ